MIVELRTTRFDRPSGSIESCCEDEAGMYSVYVGEPGDFNWLADFSTYEDAGAWATYYAKSRGYQLCDLVAEERERKAEEPVAT